jgi:hypothetical protein
MLSSPRVGAKMAAENAPAEAKKHSVTHVACGNAFSMCRLGATLPEPATNLLSNSIKIAAL